MQMSPLQADDAHNRTSDCNFFVCSNHSNGGLTGVRGNHRLRICITRLIQFNAEEFQPIANPPADCRRVLTDATGEHERVHSNRHRLDRRPCSRDGIVDLCCRSGWKAGCSHIQSPPQRLLVRSATKPPPPEYACCSMSTRDQRLTIVRTAVHRRIPAPEKNSRIEGSQKTDSPRTRYHWHEQNALMIEALVFFV